MSDVAWAFLVAGLLISLAGYIALRSWQATHSAVRWMCSPGSRIAHAIPKAELAAELVEVSALAHCGRWPAAELKRDDAAERCAACVRELERLEHRHGR